ncbi:uncharacterized protein DUF1569 [Mariniflexile fucanivorans]|uniref:Uncharacterized protein DUF1569 n=1 Tax=Mariniflexile fucanivorans TaxID=264023 RepID=A0A4R1RSU5_9FLAO|nr:DUF1569 domain-containing protein [Mariniflexile fucanivorans]TCL69100.1 uncharacterized protein DUF1569 [Mariniflexile fucanivorans]
MINIFDINEANTVIQRINNLKPDASPLWGKMSVDKMLAHCNVTYEMAFEDVHPKPTGFKKTLLKLFVKPIVVSKKPYKRNSRTAPEFIIHDSKNFELEKVRLINYILKAISLGEDYFDNRESLSFGKLTKNEWNTMFYKHLDHHLNQFGA